METRLFLILVILSLCYKTLATKSTKNKNKIEINEDLLTKYDMRNVQDARRTRDDSLEKKEESEKANEPHSRKKRLIWLTNDGRLALPPGTTLVITPSLSLPLVRHPPEGFFSNISISLPLTVDFDKLGLTDNENPIGDLPPIFDRSFGRGMGQMTADLVAKFIEGRRRGKRNIHSNLPKEVQDRAMDLLHGGERALLFGTVEDLLANFGMEGKPCLLRAICEVHAHPLTNYGFLGEMLKLFLTASKSPFSHLLEEYVAAEKAGSGVDGGPGECWPYYKNCPKSLFVPKRNKYTQEAQDESPEYTQDSNDENYVENNDIHE